MSIPKLSFPSLASELFPSITSLEESLSAAAHDMDRIALWNSDTSSHVDLLRSLTVFKELRAEWFKALRTKLKSLWLNSTAQYQEYKSTVDKTLIKRHRAELELMFPHLRTTSKEIDLATLNGSSITAEVRNLFALGFRYDQGSEGSSLKLTALATRQSKERELFLHTAQDHIEQLAAARAADEALLEERLVKPLKLLDEIVDAVEKKIEASHKMMLLDVHKASHA